MRRTAALILPILLLISLALAHDGTASIPDPDRIIQVARLTGGENSLSFGYALAISGNTLAVGDPYDTQAGESSGAVTIFQADISGHWHQVARVTPLDAEVGIFFGRSVALSGDRLLVGAPYDNDFGVNSGSVYIFERHQGGPDAWGQVAKLTASDAAQYDLYGWAVTVDGDTLVTSAYTNAIGGRVYVYQRDAGGPGMWGETAQLIPDPPGFVACFGISLDLEADLLLIGAYGGGDYSGNAYVFQRQPGSDEWLRLARFHGSDTAAYHYFGYAVALDGWTALAGAPGVDGLTGAAYIFSADPAQPQGWTEQKRLVAGDGAQGDYFGYQLEISGDTAWVGAPMRADDTGAVYLYGKDQGGAGSWGAVTTLMGNETAAGDVFGYRTSVDGHLAAVGAPGRLPAGAAYIFDFDPPWLTRLPLVMH